MRLLVDVNLLSRWVNRLADAGIEAVHWSKVGLPVASDTEIMADARADDYVVLTHDLDFSAILAATGGDRPSVVQIRSDDVSRVSGLRSSTPCDRPRRTSREALRSLSIRSAGDFGCCRW
jgi:predicted nuclease of predicted toxin-antitoxin system